MMLLRDSIFWQYKVCVGMDICRGSLEQISNDSGVACYVHVLWSHAEVYSLFV